MHSRRDGKDDFQAPAGEFSIALHLGPVTIDALNE